MKTIEIQESASVKAVPQTDLAAEAMWFFDGGYRVFLTDTETSKPIAPYSEWEPAVNRDKLLALCAENPTANLQVVADGVNLVILAVGVGSWASSGEDSFAELTQEYGVPKTLSYIGADGAKYYLFKPSQTGTLPKPGPGLRLIRSDEGIAVFPSVVADRAVKKMGPDIIQSIDAWLHGQDEREEISVESHTCSEIAVEAEKTTAEAPEMVGGQLAEGTVEEVPASNPATIDLLRQDIRAWLATGDDRPTVLSKALTWDKGTGEALKTEDIATVVDELTVASAEKVAPLTPRDLLFKLAESMTLFHDDQTRPYFFYEGEAFAAPSEHVKQRLTHLYLKETNDLPPKKELNAVLGILQSKARFDGPRIALFNRVASSIGAFFYDLRDKRYVKVTPDGWGIVAPFPLFRRFQHLQPQVEPVRGGDPWKVFDFLTVPEESRLLLMVYIASLFVPRIAHPIFAVCGDQGSAKSFLCTVINRLVDPTLTERVIQPKNERDLIQTLRQKYVTVLDNLSKFNDRVSDIFCQVCTGGSISLRQLYTDEGENIAQFRHVVILNSINLAIQNADLMDRSIILKLRRINTEDRKPEHELWEAFEAARPEIVGGIFDTISRAMKIYPTVKVEHLPRLADFAKWGYAIAEALGESGEQFLKDFSQNVKRQNESVVEKDVLCQSVLALMAEGTPYLAKVGEAHATLKSIAKEDAKDATFPKLPHHLRGKLDRLRPSLEEHGITYEFFDREGAGVKILFTKSGSLATPPAPKPVPDTPTLRFGKADEPDEADEALSGLPEVDFHEMPEVVHG